MIHDRGAEGTEKSIRIVLMWALACTILQIVIQLDKLNRKYDGINRYGAHKRLAECNNCS